ncbi:MAG: phenylacetate--CoA ligase family protein [Deltaproteobacteria bacterium]|nr:MAG: phenylacetate--CoA ligase family protein [Deltaproteobacteria bacterium]
MKSRTRFIKKMKDNFGKISDALKYERIIDLERSQWWNYQDLLAFQNQRLRKIVEYAHKKVPGYRAKFLKANVTPADIQSVDDLYKLPVTTREEIQDNDLFINNELITGTLYTGGSTGTTLKYHESKESGIVRWHMHLRGWRWGGYEYGQQRLAVISSAQGIVHGVNTVNLVGDLRETNMRKNSEHLQEFKPHHLRGYVSSVYILAKYCLDTDTRLDSVESVNTISENLYDFQRTTIENAFDCEVFEEYCCNDGGACGWECEAHSGLHYCMERAIIEEVDGEMIVTDLWNKATPFIRYKNGDAVEFLGSPCSCGRELPLMWVSGRQNDILITPSGPISPSFLIHHGCGQVGLDRPKGQFHSGIRSIQYIQEPGYGLRVNLVENSWCTPNEIEEFKDTLEEIAPGMQTTVQVVDELEMTEKGKRHFIVNKDKNLLRKWGYNC